MIIARMITAVIVGYLVGSIPFGVLVSKRLARVDVRDYGSGKIGTTNVLRTAGRKAAALVALCDISKGALAVLATGLMLRGEYLVVGSILWWLARSAPVLAGLAAVAGHNWSIFLKFRGGRGVATFFGGLVALSPPVAIFSGEIALLGAGVTRFASLGSLAGAVGSYSVLVPLTIINGFPIEYLAYTLVGTVVIIVMHRDNIARLMSGRERRIGEKAEKIDSPPPEKSTG